MCQQDSLHALTCWSQNCEALGACWRWPQTYFLGLLVRRGEETASLPLARMFLKYIPPVQSEERRHSWGWARGGSSPRGVRRTQWRGEQHPHERPHLPHTCSVGPLLAHWRLGMTSKPAPRMPRGHPAGPASTAGLGFPSGAPAASQRWELPFRNPVTGPFHV